MLAFSVLVAILVSAAAIAYVAWPLVESRPAPVVVEDDRLTDLVGRKDATLIAIKELEFDFNTGKLSEEDFQRMDQRLRRQAIGYIQQIEKLAPESALADSRIEAEIARLRKTQTQGSVSAVVSSATETATAARPQQPTPVAADGAETATESAPHFCTNCGNRLQPTHKFCAKCGTPVVASVPNSS